MWLAVFVPKELTKGLRNFSLNFNMKNKTEIVLMSKISVRFYDTNKE